MRMGRESLDCSSGHTRGLNMIWKWPCGVEAGVQAFLIFLGSVTRWSIYTMEIDHQLFGQDTNWQLMIRSGVMQGRTLVQRERCWKQLRTWSGASPSARYSCGPLLTYFLDLRGRLSLVSTDVEC